MFQRSYLSVFVHPGLWLSHHPLRGRDDPEIEISYETPGTTSQRWLPEEAECLAKPACRPVPTVAVKVVRNRPIDRQAEIGIPVLFVVSRCVYLLGLDVLSDVLEHLVRG